MNPLLVVVLRLFHIVAGSFWVGGVATLGIFILPSVMAAGPAGGAVVRELVQVRKMPARFLASGIVTIIAGLALYMADSKADPEFGGSHFGITLGIGALLAISTILLGIFVNIPTAKKMGAVSAAVQARGGPPSPEEAAQIAAFQKKLLGVTRIATALLMLTVALMAVARYV